MSRRKVIELTASCPVKVKLSLEVFNFSKPSSKLSERELYMMPGDKVIYALDSDDNYGND